MDVLQCMVDAVERVHRWRDRSNAALAKAGIWHALAGESAAAAHIAAIDPTAVRFARHAEFAICEPDLPQARAALTNCGLADVSRGTAALFAELEASNRPIVKLSLSNDRFEGDHLEGMRVQPLDALARIALQQLTANDCVNIRDMIDVGLIDQSWTQQLPPILSQRLQALLDTPGG
jgi:hypothetical protein